MPTCVNCKGVELKDAGDAYRCPECSFRIQKRTVAVLGARQGEQVIVPVPPPHAAHSVWPS